MGKSTIERSRLNLLVRSALALGVGLSGLLLTTGCSTQTPVTTLRERGDQYYGRSEYHDAARQYAQITERYPGDWYAQMRLGQSFIETGDYSAAVHSLRIAQATRPDYDEINDSLAEAMYRAGNVNALVMELNERAAVGGTANDYLRLAKYSLLNDDPDSARFAAERAIDLDEGRHVEPFLAAADVARQVGDRTEVLMLLREAYDVDPRDPRVIDGLRDLGEIPGPTLAMPTER